MTEKRRQKLVKELRDLAVTFRETAKEDYYESGADLGELFAGDHHRIVRMLRAAAVALESQEVPREREQGETT